MKTSIVVSALVIASAHSFAPAVRPNVAASSAQAFAPAVRPNVAASSQRFMFGGAGEAGAMEDDPEKLKSLEQGAKAMGMSVEEYQLGIQARMKFESDIGAMRVKSGSDDVGVEVDGQSPPNHLVVTISEAGKSKGKDAVSKELTTAFKSVTEEAKKGRQEAQKNMMQFIGDQLKK